MVSMTIAKMAHYEQTVHWRKKEKKGLGSILTFQPAVSSAGWENRWERGNGGLESHC